MSLTRRWGGIPAPLPTLILVNLTAHLALSGGRLSGSLFTLRAGAGEVWAAVFMGLFAAVPLLSSLRVGRWIDRVGAAHVMRRGSLLVLAGAWLPVLYLSVPMLYAMAMLMGIGYNLVSMAGLHTVGAVSAGQSSQQRLANFGWLGLGFATSATLGPSISGLLIDHFGFRAALTAMACSSALAVLLVFTRMARPEPTHAPADDAHAAVLPATAWYDLLREPRLRRLMLVALTISSSWDLFVVMLPVVGTRLGFSASVVGSISSTFALGVFISRALTPWLAVRFPEWKNVRLALAGIVLVFLLLPWARSSGLFIALALALGLSIGLSQPNTMSLMHGATPRARVGEALGLRYFMGNCSSVLMPLLFGVTLAPLGVLPILWACAALCGNSLLVAHRATREVPMA